MEPQPRLRLPSPDKKKLLAWPIFINLMLLVVCVITGGLGALVSSLPMLLVLNGLAAAFIHFSGGKMPYGKALFLAITLSMLLLLLLISLSMCATPGNP